jgi:Xaa-Pro aminopeptidase
MDMVASSHEECAAYVARRKALLNLIKKSYPDKHGALLLCSAFEKEREQFYQDSSFLYLTGLLEPGVVLLQLLDGEAALYEPNYQVDRSVWLPIMYDKKYLQELDITKIELMGEQAPGYALDAFVQDAIYAHLANSLKKIIADGGVIFTPLTEVQFECRSVIDKLCRLVPELKNNLIDSAPLIAQLRRKKEQQELEYLYRAVEITAIAQEAAAGVIKPSKRESDVQAAIDYIFTEAQATRAFASVVGSGKNSTVLHYVDNKDVLQKDDLVVVDIGASFHHYCGDITRTYPVTGKFTDRQKEVYEIVLSTQEFIAAQARPGLWLKNKDKPKESLHHMAYEFLKEQGYEKYFPHGIGHFVGLDVHDVGDYTRPLAQGDVITIEPGIYISEEKLGIRIEDMYWIVEDEAVCLSEGIPKTIKEIEDLMKYNQLKEEEKTS